MKRMTHRLHDCYSERHKILRFAQNDTSRGPYPVGVILSGGEAEVVSQTCAAQNLLTLTIIVESSLCDINNKPQKGSFYNAKKMG